MTKILLVDDDADLVEMLSEYLAVEGYEVRVVHNGSAAISEALSGQYALAILDVMMPGLSGVDVLRQIRQQSQMPVLMLTARGDDMDRIVGLELGADDYVRKPCTPRELTARVRAILRRACLVSAVDHSPVSINIDKLVVWPQLRRAEWNGVTLALTSSEYNILEVLVRHAGRPVNKNDLSVQALGRPLSRYDRSIDVHLSSIRPKLGLLPDGRSRIQTVYRQGYQYIKE